MSTSVLLTVVLGAFALIAGAFYALVHVLGERIAALDAGLGARFDVGIRNLSDRIDGIDRRLDAQGESLAAVREAVAGLSERVGALERH